MEYKIVIPGRFPGMNEFIQANRSAHGIVANSMKRNSQKEISAYLKQQLKALHITKPVFIRYVYYEPNRKRDLDNISGYFHKVFQDALVHNKVITDDGWSYVVGFSDNFHVSKDPRIEITLEEVER